MARFAVVRENAGNQDWPFVVENVVEAASAEACAHLEPVAPAPDDVGRGWLYNGSEFSEPPASAPPVPDVVTPFQARAALRAAGLLDGVLTLVAAADATTQDAWEYATEFRRTSPLLNGLAQQLGMTDQQLDQLFIAAAAIEV